jgi:hypothetical protein
MQLNYLEKLESTLSKNGFGLLLSILLLFGVSAVCHVNFITAHHGNEFSLLSENPFDFARNNDLQMRILSPLLGYMLFLRGPLFKYFMLFILYCFISLLYVSFRRKNFTVAESVVVTSILAFSTLTFYQLYFPAYTDPLSFILILLTLIFYDRKVFTTICLSLLLFNHESNVFIFPFFFLLMLGKNFSLKNISVVITQFIIAFIPYLIYRQYVLNHTKVEYTLQYYLDPVNMQWTREHVFPNLASGIFQAFRVAWLIPLIAIGINLYEKRFFEIVLILSAIIFVAMQFLIAYDISRLMGLAFPSLLIGLFRMKKTFSPKIFHAIIISVLIIDIILPAYCVGALDPIPYRPGWLF